MQPFLEITAKYLGPAGVAAFLVGLGGWRLLHWLLSRTETMQAKYLESLQTKDARIDLERDRRLADKDQAAKDLRDLADRLSGR